MRRPDSRRLGLLLACLEAGSRDWMTRADNHDDARNAAGGPRRDRGPAVTAHAALPLAAASRRLRRPAGRPPSRSPIDRTGLTPSGQAGPAPHRADPLLSRGLSVKDAAAYVGVSVRDLWRRVERGELAVVRWPGCRRVVFDRHDLDKLFSPEFKASR